MLSPYHRHYADYSEEEIRKRADEKENELKRIFEVVSLKTSDDVVRLAIIGCADKRFFEYHEKMFENLLQKPIEMITFDITTEHLGETEMVVRHDCTEPLLGAPYDVIYAHVLLKFIETEKQWNVIMNSYNALKVGGMAIQVLDTADYETKTERQSDGYFSVPLDRYKQKLEACKMQHSEIPLKYGKALVLERMET